MCFNILFRLMFHSSLLFLLLKIFFLFICCFVCAFVAAVVCVLCLFHCTECTLFSWCYCTPFHLCACVYVLFHAKPIQVWVVKLVSWINSTQQYVFWVKIYTENKREWEKEVTCCTYIQREHKICSVEMELNWRSLNSCRFGKRGKCKRFQQK